MVDPDRPAPPPTLNPRAKHYERQLHKIFAVDTAAIWLTQQNWIDAKAQLEDLAKDVRGVRTELTAPADGGKGWTGPAADAALASLQKLSDTLDGHAVKVGDVDASLKNVYDAVWEAKNAWDTKVASISTYVDPEDHKRLPAPYAPTAENVANHSVTDHEAVAAAEDARWEQRNQAAKQVLQDLGVQTQEAMGKMPIEAKDSGEGPYRSTGTAPGADYGTNTSRPSSSGGYEVSPSGPTGVNTGVPGTRDPDTGVVFPPLVPEVPEVVTIEPVPEDHGTDPISSDGDTTGSTGPVGPGTSAAASHAGGGGGGGIGPGGIAAGGVGAGAAGLGGLLGARRGGGVVPGGGTQARGGAAGSRGSAMRSGGASRTGQVIPGGGGSQARGGASTRGSAVKGASGSGRYGVPKLDGRGGGVVPSGSGQAAKGGARGGAGASGRGSAARDVGRGGAAMGAVGARGSRKDDRNPTEDVDKLTHEDEDTWYDGTEESSPQVWD